METGYATAGSRPRQYADELVPTAENPMGEKPAKAVAQAVNNLTDEINGLSALIDQMGSRLGVAMRPMGAEAAKDSAKEAELPASLLTRKIGEQAKRVRALSNQIATALEALEL